MHRSSELRGTVMRNVRHQKLAEPKGRTAMAANDANQRDYTAIPAHLRDVYVALENELVWIHGRWIMYRQLFGTNELRIELLNDVAPSFFGELQSLWMDYILLEICRITEIKPKNLVLRQFCKLLGKNQYPSLAIELDGILENVRRTTEPLRAVRNRSVAHLNRSTVLGTRQSPLPGISRQNIEDALGAIREFMNAIELEFSGTELGFEDLIMQDDANTLIFNLRRAVEYRALEKENHEYRSRVRSGRFHDA
jgi:AbiU2